MILKKSILQATMNLTQVHANNVDALRIIYNSLVILCKVFYSLNFQVSVFVTFIYMQNIKENLLLRAMINTHRIYQNFLKTIWKRG